MGEGAEGWVEWGGGGKVEGWEERWGVGGEGGGRVR